MCPYLKEFLRLSFLYQVVRVLINRSSAISLVDFTSAINFRSSLPGVVSCSSSEEGSQSPRSIPNHPLMSREMGCVPILMSFLPLTIACSLK